MARQLVTVTALLAVQICRASTDSGTGPATPAVAAKLMIARVRRLNMPSYLHCTYKLIS